MSTRLRALLFDLAFCLTGIGTALLGATLPATLHQGQLSDAKGGLLLLAGWGGSTSGALLARGNLGRNAGLGLALSAFALLAMSKDHPVGLLPLYLAYGVGLGLTMTAISILRSREVPTADADLILNRLNLLWASGACLSPVLALHSLRLLSVAALYRGMGAVFASVAFVVLSSSLFEPPSAPGPRLTSVPMQTWAPLRFGLFAAASVGLESALGSWLTTYAERSASGVGTAVSANSAFWLGLLLSRAAHSARRARWLHTKGARAAHIGAVGIATASLLLFPNHSVIPAAGLLCGLGLGPLYPYVLSLTLPRYRSVMIFVIAGVGSAVVPWLTGTLSSAEGSLRTGLLVPAAVFLVLVISAMRIAANDGTPRPQTVPCSQLE